MTEEFLELPEAEVLAEHGEVVVSVEREADPNEVKDLTLDQSAEVILLDFGPATDLTEHMGETAFEPVADSNIRIFAPTQSVQSQSPERGTSRLHAEAGVANRIEVEFTTQGTKAA